MKKAQKATSVSGKDLVASVKRDRPHENVSELAAAAKVGPGSESEISDKGKTLINKAIASTSASLDDAFFALKMHLLQDTFEYINDNIGGCSQLGVKMLKAVFLCTGEWVKDKSVEFPSLNNQEVELLDFLIDRERDLILNAGSGEAA